MSPLIGVIGFIVFGFIIMFGLIGWRLYKEKPDGKFPNGIKYNFINSNKTINGNEYLYLTDYLHSWFFIIGNTDIFKDRKNIFDEIDDFCNKMIIDFYEPRILEEKEYPAIYDPDYLNRRLSLGYGKPSLDELNDKVSRGEFDFIEKKFYASGRCLSQYRIEITYYSDLNKLWMLIAWELTNALIWYFKGGDIARQEDSFLHKQLSEIAKRVMIED